MQRKYLVFLLSDSLGNGSYRHCTNLLPAAYRTVLTAVCPRRVGRANCWVVQGQAAPASKSQNLGISSIISLLIYCIAAVKIVLSSILSYLSESSEFRLHCYITLYKTIMLNFICCHDRISFLCGAFSCHFSKFAAGSFTAGRGLKSNLLGDAGPWG